jgi:hypothetical protein
MTSLLDDGFDNGPASTSRSSRSSSSPLDPDGIVGRNGVVMTALWPGVWAMDEQRRRRAIATRL